jgi:tetratricopeptide (TPR) repeat protein
MIGYTAREVAEVLDLSVRQVRSYARSELLSPRRGPRNEYRFTFRDIVVLRAASELLKARVHPRKVRRALHRLHEQLPRGRSLAEVRIATDGDQVVVRDRDTVWEPDSGQVVLSFAVAELASRAAPFARRVVREGSLSEHVDPDEWYNLAHDLEAVSTLDAKEAYRRAVAADARHTEAHLNLGRLLHEEGLLEEAERNYRKALGADPTVAIAWYNLGVVLEDQKRRREAVEAYEQALLCDPELAFAHYNLSRLYEEEGATSSAIRHLAEYRRLKGARS